MALIPIIIKQTLALLLFVLPCISYGWNENNPYPIAVIQDKVNGYDLVPYLSYLKQDRARSLSYIQDQLSSGAFSPLTRDYPNLGFQDGYHWFHFALKNSQERKISLLVEVDYAYLDFIEFHCAGLGRDSVPYLGGDQIPYHDRVIKTRNYLFPVALPAKAKVDCFIQIQSDSHLALPIKLFDEISFIEKSMRSEQLLGLLYGIALALLIYNLIQYAQKREVIYLYFCLHVFGGVLYTSFSDGSLSSLWIPLGLQDSGNIIAIYLCSIGILKFTSLFLELKQQAKRLAQVCDGLTLLAILASTYSLFDSNRNMFQLATVYAFLASFFLLATGIKRFKDGFKPAGVYLLGFGVVFSLVGWMVLNLIVFHSNVYWVTYGLGLIWLVELVAFSKVLNDRVKQIESERSTLEEKVQSVRSESQLKTEFMAKVSHEIRTPMNGMLGLVELLMSTPLNKDQKRYISALQNAGRGLLDVINDILDFSRIEAGKMALTNQVFDLKELLHDACAIYEYDARQKRIELGCFVAPGTPLKLIGDANRIRQVILNILSNALKFTEKGYVHINVHLTDHIHNDKLVLRFEVEDSGVGISELDQGKLFQSYSQLNAGPHKTGAGLGLVISQQFVELMGGEMGVQSESGAGSCFWFNLPFGLPEDVVLADGAVMLDLFNGDLANEELESPRNEILATEEPNPNKQGHILIVEDNVINQNVISEFLQKMHFKVDLAENGRSAVERIQSNHHYDLVLMDCEMPVMDGYEAATRIIKWQKSIGRTSMPIIALSAHALDKHRKLAFDAGMVDYIVKPITYDMLRKKISRFLDLKELTPE